jgi:16S rRNA C1402 N4-methylase RsmH
MPLQVDSLSPDSADDVIQNAISESVAACISEGGERDQCVAMAHDIAKRKTGRNLGRGGAARIRVGMEKE